MPKLKERPGKEKISKLKDRGAFDSGTVKFKVKTSETHISSKISI